MSVDEPKMQKGIHWPHCIERTTCKGCMPEPILPPPTAREYKAALHGLDLTIFGKA
jgi:hypothetical protein